MRRLPSNLAKLSDLEKHMAAEAAALTKKRNALLRQRQRLEKQAQTEQYIAAGKLVEQLGLPITDLAALEQTLKTLTPDTQTTDHRRTMSTTALCPTTPGKSDG